MANIIRKVVGHEFTVSNSWLATQNTFAKLECGHLKWLCAGHNATNLPSEAPCEYCGDIDTHKANIAKWQTTGRITHTRARYCHSDGTYSAMVYGRDEPSPTGVILLGSVPDIPELKYFLTGSLAPLSPTER
jgi:hypothetical protein